MTDNLNYFWFLIAMIFFSFIEARPVSYPGGITLMQMNDTNKNSFHLHYSPTAKVSINLNTGAKKNLVSMHCK